MALLFVVGVMSMLWIAPLAVLVLAEKVIPAGRLVLGLMAWGRYMLVSALQQSTRIDLFCGIFGSARALLGEAHQLRVEACRIL